jgi:hypothetical protein
MIDSTRIKNEVNEKGSEWTSKRVVNVEREKESSSSNRSRREVASLSGSIVSEEQ